MALIDTLNTLTRKVYMPGFADNIYAQSAFLSETMAHRVQKSGSDEGFVMPIKSGKLGGGPYVPGALLDLTTGEVATYSKYQWKNYYVPIQLPAQTVDLNASASGSEKILDLLDAYIDSAGETMRDDHLGTDVFLTSEDGDFDDGDGTTQHNATLDGLEDMCSEINDPIDTYGGYNDGSYYGFIDLDDMASWSANVVRCTGAGGAWVEVACTVENVRSILNEIVNGASFGCGEQPSLAVTTPTVYQALSRELFNRGVVNTINMRTERLVAAGFNAIEIDNVTIIPDPHCPGIAFDGTDAADTDYKVQGGHRMFFVNFDYFYPVIVPKWDMVFDEWLKAPVTRHQYTNRLFWWGNLGCNQRRAQGALYNIDPTVVYDS